MIFTKKFLPFCLTAASLTFAGQVFAKSESPSPVQADATEGKPVALGADMYLMKSGGMWGSVMHLNKEHPQHPAAAGHAPAAASQEVSKSDAKKTEVPKPDLCVASDQNQILILRASAGGLEVRSIGKAWNLKKDILTAVKIAVGKEYKADLTMQALSKDQIGVPVKLDQMVHLVDALSNNDEAVLTYALKEKNNKGKTNSEKTKTEIRKVSLKLAQPVFDDFRECVRFSGMLHAKNNSALTATASKK